MKNRLVIKGRLSSLNDYTRENRTHKYKGAKNKNDNEKIVCIGIVESAYKGILKKVDKYPIKLKITWYEPNMKRDLDNIVFATKFIQDALVKRGIIENDSQKYIKSIEHTVLVDRLNPRIEVELEEL